jgi:hypothetical protein
MIDINPIERISILQMGPRMIPENAYPHIDEKLGTLGHSRHSGSSSRAAPDPVWTLHTNLGFLNTFRYG